MAEAALIDIWVNCPDRKSADAIAEVLIGERLAACANILAPIASVYQWKGKVERDDEVPLVLKSRSDLFDAAAARIKDLHPFETPSIVAMELPLVEDDYAQWLRAETVRPAVGDYRPRRAAFRELLRCGEVPIKLSTITADGKTVEAPCLARATDRIASAAPDVAATQHEGAGFAILHEGEEGRWLLLHWWLPGGIAARRLWRADPIPEADFVPAEPHLMACVWELGLIDFERRAWMRTHMAGGTVSDYLEDTFSGETV